MACRYCFKKQSPPITLPPLSGLFERLENYQKEPWWNFVYREDAYALLAAMKSLITSDAQMLLLTFLKQIKPTLLDFDPNRKILANLLILVATPTLSQKLKEIYEKTNSTNLRLLLIEALATLLPPEEASRFFCQFFQKEKTFKAVAEMAKFYQSALKPKLNETELGKIWEQILTHKNPKLGYFFTQLVPPRFPLYPFSEQQLAIIKSFDGAAAEMMENQVLLTNQYPAEAFKLFLNQNSTPRQRLLLAHYFDAPPPWKIQLTTTDLYKIFQVTTSQDWQTIPGLDHLRQFLFRPEQQTELQKLQAFILQQKNIILTPPLLQKLFLETPIAKELLPEVINSLPPLPNAAELPPTLENLNCVNVMSHYATAMALAEQEGDVVTSQTLQKRYFEFLGAIRQKVLTDLELFTDLDVLEEISDFYRQYLPLYPAWFATVAQQQVKQEYTISFLDLVIIHSQKETPLGWQLLNDFDFTAERLTRDCRGADGIKTLSVLRKSPALVDWLLDQIEQKTVKGRYLLDKMFLSEHQDEKLTALLKKESLFPYPSQNQRFFEYVTNKMVANNFLSNDNSSQILLASVCHPQQIPIILNWGQAGGNPGIINVAAQIKRKWSNKG